nr:proline-rich proteoglycan 2-like isoform X2 [Vicugna pacos]
MFSKKHVIPMLRGPGGLPPASLPDSPRRPGSARLPPAPRRPLALGCQRGELPPARGLWDFRYLYWNVDRASAREPARPLGKTLRTPRAPRPRGESAAPPPPGASGFAPAGRAGACAATRAQGRTRPSPHRPLRLGRHRKQQELGRPRRVDGTS